MVKRNVDILIAARDKASKNFNKVSRSTDRFANNLARTSAAGISTEAMLIGMGAAAAAAAGSWAALRGSFMQAAEFEQLNVAFEVLIGNLDQSQILMKQLVGFSIRTPFEPDEVLKASKQLLAFGFEVRNINGLIEMLGELSAGSGAKLAKLGRITGKVFTKGRAQAEELNQFAEAGIPIIQELAKIYGKTEREILKMGEKGELAFEDIEKAMISLTGKGGKFFGLMEKQSKTQIGLWSTLTGAVKETGKGFGNFLLPATKAITGDLISMVNVLNEVIDGFNIILRFRPETLGGDPIERKKRQPFVPENTKKSAEEITKELQLWALESQKVEVLSKKYGINLAEAQAILALSKNDQTITLFQLEKENETRKKIAADKAREHARALTAFTSARKSADQTLQGLRQQLGIQKLLNAGKEREAFIQEGINKTFGKGFTSEEIDKIAKARAKLFDLQQGAKGTGTAEPTRGPLAATVSRFLSFRQPAGDDKRIAEDNQKNNQKTAENTFQMKALLATLIDQVRNQDTIPISAANFGG